MSAAEAVAQRDAALSRANEVRTRQAALKRGLRTRTLALADALADPAAQRMPLATLLLALPRVGMARVRRVLNRLRLSETVTVGALAPQRRAAVVAEVGAGGQRG